MSFSVPCLSTVKNLGISRLFHSHLFLIRVQFSFLHSSGRIHQFPLFCKNPFIIPRLFVTYFFICWQELIWSYVRLRPIGKYTPLYLVYFIEYVTILYQRKIDYTLRQILIFSSLFLQSEIIYGKKKFNGFSGNNFGRIGTK